jgi:hypothetical protein
MRFASAGTGTAGMVMLLDAVAPQALFNDDGSSAMRTSTHVFVWSQPESALHTSAVHVLSSLHKALLGLCVTTSIVSSQASTVHARPSFVSGGVPCWQPSVALHASTPLQNAPSLQALSLGVWSQLSVASLHASVVQPTLSLQIGGAPARQPFVVSQVSAPLQNCPSLQALLFGVWSQVSVASLHASVVQLTASLQIGDAPARQQYDESHDSEQKQK